MGTVRSNKTADYNDFKPKIKMTVKHIICDNGQFFPLSQPLVKFMGLTNAVFLSGIIDHYNYLSLKRKVKKGELYYNATTFQKKWRISSYQQKNAIRELSKIGLLKETGKTFRNQKTLKIYILRCCWIVHLIYKLKADICLPTFFDKLLKSKKFRGFIWGGLKKMKSDPEWDGDEFFEHGCSFSFKKFKGAVLKYLKTNRVVFLKF